MSRKLNLQTLSDKDLEKFSTELNIAKEASKYAFSSKPSYIQLYDLVDNTLYIPFAYGKNYPRPKRQDFTTVEIKFSGTLRPEQKEVREEAFKYLNSSGSTIISAGCGFGKTCTSLNIASKINLKTLIVCHRVVLINQWKNDIYTFCPESKVQVLSSRSKLQDCDFYIINAVNITKHPREYYRDIGFVIVDEAHLILAEKMCKGLQYINPRYIVGLSATPYRNDGLDILFDMYFGENKIFRKFWRHHIVYRISSNIKIDAKLNKLGKIDWGSVIESQSDNPQRNEGIIKLIKSFPERVFLVLCKRVSQAEYLVNRLQEENESVTSLIGTEQTYDSTSRVLVGIVQKCSTGFNHPRLDALILGSDVQDYFVQYLGRVFRTLDTVPIIFDIVDNFPLLIRHYETRSAVYVEHGGVIKDFFKEFHKISLF